MAQIGTNRSDNRSKVQGRCLFKLTWEICTLPVLLANECTHLFLVLYGEWNVHFGHTCPLAVPAQAAAIFNFFFCMVAWLHSPYNMVKNGSQEAMIVVFQIYLTRIILSNLAANTYNTEQSDRSTDQLYQVVSFLWAGGCSKRDLFIRSGCTISRWMWVQ